MYDFSTCGEGGEDKSSMPDLSISKITKKKPINSITFINMSVILNKMIRIHITFGRRLQNLFKNLIDKCFSLVLKLKGLK